jgi:peroxiredoxin
MGPPQPGDAAPALELPDLAGKSVRLADARGAWIVLHFTASWCPFCDAEVEHLGTLAKDYAKRNVRVLLVDLQEDQERWHAYAKDNVDAAVTALWDETGDTARKFAPPRAQPSFDDRAQVMFDSTLVIDPAGTIRLFLLPDSAHFDPTFKAVRRELDAMMAEGKKP